MKIIKKKKGLLLQPEIECVIGLGIFNLSFLILFSLYLINNLILFLCKFYLILGIYNMDIIIVKMKNLIYENMSKIVKALFWEGEVKESLGSHFS